MSITYAAYDNVLRDDTGRAIVNAEIYVYRADTGTLAQLYDLAGNPVGQPLSTDQHGGIDNGSTHSAEARQGFRAPGGRYLIRSFKNGVEGRRIPEVMIGGTIVEQGQNANGSYWRWESGLQLCLKIDTGAIIAANTQWGNGFVSESIIWTYPAAFASVPYSSGVYRHTSLLSWAVPETSSSVSYESFRFMETRQDTNPTAPGTLRLIAIGRWK